MKQVFSLIILCVSTSLGAQNIHWMHLQDDTLKNRLELGVEADLGSDEISNHLFFKTINGGGLEREKLQEISSSMNGRSSTGFYSDARLRYSAIPDSSWSAKNKSIFLELGNVIYGDARLQGDLFHLLFLGNADRLGENLELGKTDFRSMIFQYAGLGLMNEKTGSYVSANLVNVQSYFGASLNNTNLYTGELAETLTLDYQGEFTVSDTLSGNFLSNSGLGFALNARYNLPLRNDEDLFSVEVRNLGMAVLNRPTTTYSGDSTLTFSGLSINQLITDADYFNGISISDSLAYETESSSQTVNLPASISMKYLNRINPSDHVQFSARKFIMRSHQVELGIDYLHKETDHIAYAIGMSYGGFNQSLRFRIGANFDYKNWNLSLHSTHAVGLVLEKAKGFNLSFGIQRKLYTSS